ncbi:MerR family transcriptional regulator [Shouchella hunanensis]|uniref:MerR family transcriptional regulator n=1 Tax=Shouchella hunanensis TaxID=766894 RepID=A0ABY7WA37_9BACI|nr:MerR family transcriptional regulator [Shouchella hunanensis]WDF05541.1 MerR family transcriptional regulator [Shouchella hunanensis]
MATNLGIKEHTLRYYEQIGLIVPKRDENNVRLYSKEDQDWVEFVMHMKETGMTLEKLKRYIDLWHSDDDMEELLAILDEHKQNVKNQISVYQANLELLDKKITFYEYSKQNGTDKNLFKKFVDDNQGKNKSEKI